MSQTDFKTDQIPAQAGTIEITFIGHASLMIIYNGKNIQIDPFSSLADYSVFPKADIILITHHHFDHLDTNAILKVKKENTHFVITDKCKDAIAKFGNFTVMKNGDTKKVEDIEIKAVPAYNILHKRDGKNPFHPKGEGNGYIFSLGGKTIYIAGDTENTPEIKQLKNIDLAFLPMNLPYTMTPEMLVDVTKSIKPKILYPYHFSETDTSKLVELLKNDKETEVRIREMK